MNGWLFRFFSLCFVWSLSCEMELPSGVFGCKPGGAETCPRGWFCEDRTGQGPRCWAELGRCGDGVKNGNEACDGDNLGGVTCAALGYYQGKPRCNADCSGVDPGGCTGYCGDGVVNGPEQCDGLDQRGLSCTSTVGYTGGALGCNALCQHTFDTCLRPWLPVDPGSTWNLNRIWGSSSKDIYVVSSEGTLHYNGNAWTQLLGASGGSVWGSSWDDVFHTGSGQPGKILHYDGKDWNLVNIPVESLGQLSGSSANNLIAIGPRYSVLRYDGTTWTTLRPGDNWVILDIWTSSPTNAYAIRPGNSISHYDGVAWTSEVFPSVLQFYGVWGTSERDVFLVGLDRSGIGVIFHYNGTAWTSMPAGNPRRLSGVWGRSTSDVFAVGQLGTILHYDGVSWTPMPSGTDKNLYKVGGEPGRDVYVTGADATLLRFEGGAWLSQPSGVSESLQAVWSDSARDAISVGNGGTIVHYDGTTWSPMPSGTTAQLLAVWGSSPADVFAVGPGGSRHYDGTAWGSSGAPYQGGLNAVWGSSPSDVYAAGDSLLLAHYNGSLWSRLPIGRVSSIWGRSPADVFAVGDSGGILHYDGTAWRPEGSGTSPRRALWGTSATHLFGFFYDGSLAYYDGTTWTPQTPPLATQLPQPPQTQSFGIWGRSSTDVFAVGGVGGILHYDGVSWSPMVSPTGAGPYGVTGSPDGPVLAVGAGGSILSFSGELPTRFGGACARPVPLYCGAKHPYFGDTTGQPSNRSTYNGASRALPGPEVYHRLDSPITGTITVRLEPHTVDLDLVLLGAQADLGCDLTSPSLAASNSAGTAPETIRFPVTQGRTYYFAVDTPGAPSGYTLTLDCQKQ